MSVSGLIPWRAFATKAYHKLAINKEGKHRDRLVIWAAALLVALAAYHPVVDRVDRSANVYRRLIHVALGNQYRFFSGSAGGEYIRIGTLLESRGGTKVRLPDDGLELVNVPRDGDRTEPNIQAVLDSANCLGIAQEDHLVRDEISEQQMKIVAPLYGEKMHVLYRRDALLRAYREEGDVEVPRIPVLATDPDDPQAAPLQRFFARSRVHMSLGTSRRGQYASDRVLEVCGLPAGERLYGRNATVERAMDALTSPGSAEAVDVAFVVGGAPMPKLSEVLDRPLSDDGIGLMSIGRDVVLALNEFGDTRVHRANFNLKYHPDFDDVSTFEVRAMLIASHDVPDSVLRQVSARLDGVKDVRPESSEKPYALSEYGWDDRLRHDLPGVWRQRLESWGGFLLFLLFVVPLLGGLGTWLVSSGKLALYFEEMTQVYKEDLPSHAELSKSSSGLSVPALGENSIETVERLVQGLSRLLGLILEIRDDFNTGGITVSHQQHLMETAYHLKEIFTRNLAQRLNEAIAEDAEVSAEELRRYYTAGYLTLEAYRDLRAQIAGRLAVVPSPRSGERTGERIGERTGELPADGSRAGAPA